MSHNAGSNLNTEGLPDVASTSRGELEPVHLQLGVVRESQQFVFSEDLSAGCSAGVVSVGSAVQTTPKLRVRPEIIETFLTF